MAKKSSTYADILQQYAANVDDNKISTGIDCLDELTNGGIPAGSMLAIWGPAGSGKSTIAFQIMKNYCKNGMKCAFIDVENAFNQSQQESFGLRKYVEDGTLSVFSVTTYADCDELNMALIESGQFNLIIIDSETMLLPKISKDLKVDDMQPGQKARQAMVLLSKLKSECSKNHVTSIIIDHARANIQMGFATNPNAPATKQAGGYAMQHIPDAILHVECGAKYKEDDVQIGQMIRLEFDKNKFSAPHVRVEKKFIYGTGISKRIDLIDTAIADGRITQSGSFYTLPWGETIRGTKNLYNLSNESLKRLKES